MRGQFQAKYWGLFMRNLQTNDTITLKHNYQYVAENANTEETIFEKEVA
jgi:hypothetical protein